jgi:hypothetical protein
MEVKMNFKKFKTSDIAFTKLSVFFVTLFLISVWNGFANWVIKTHWAWFLILGLLLAIKPLIKTFSK